MRKRVRLGNVGDFIFEEVYDAGTCESSNSAQSTVEILRDGGVVQRLSLDSVGPPAPCAALSVTLPVDDFDFDGQLDAAIPLDRSGAYGSETYEVFLFNTASAQFERSDALSDLTRSYMGMFGVDSKRHRLTAVGKSGCCIHYDAEFDVRSRRPVLVKRVTETIRQEPSCQVKVEVLRPGTSTTTTSRSCKVEDANDPT